MKKKKRKIYLHQDCHSGACAAAACHDTAHLCGLLSAGQQAVCAEKGQPSCVSDIYGAAGAFWGLFFLHCGEFYDCKKQTGESRAGKHCDSGVVSAFAVIAGKAAGGTEDSPWVLGTACGSAHCKLSVQYPGCAAGMYAGGSNRAVYGSMLPEMEAVDTYGGVLYPLPDICRAVSGAGIVVRLKEGCI